MELWSGSRVLITGASRGIRRAMVEAFAARGCATGLVARSEEELRELAHLPCEGHEVLPADVGEHDRSADAVARFGEADRVMANVGVADYAPFAEMELEDVDTHGLSSRLADLVLRRLRGSTAAPRW